MPTDYRAEQLETVLWLWAGVLERRTDTRLGGRRRARRRDCPTPRPAVGSGISQSAVSQRAQAAGLVDGRRAQRLAVVLLAALLAGPTGGTIEDSEQDRR